MLRSCLSCVSIFYGNVYLSLTDIHLLVPWVPFSILWNSRLIGVLVVRTTSLTVINPFIKVLRLLLSYYLESSLLLRTGYYDGLISLIVSRVFVDNWNYWHLSFVTRTFKPVSRSEDKVSSLFKKGCVLTNKLNKNIGRLFCKVYKD